MLLPKDVQIYHHQQPFSLEQGGQLPELHIAYHTYGQLNANKDNVVWVCHALTANSNATDWWAGIIGGEAAIIHPDKHFIVCVNVLGSFYGSTNPRSIHPQTAKPYGIDFPRFTVRDVVATQDLLRQHLGIQQIALGIGGSFGGHQILEYALCFPKVFQSIFLLATSARETAWSIAIHESQRMAIETDPSWQENTPQAGAEGLKTARAIGLISYRTIDAYIQTQTDQEAKLDDFRASSYVRYQGDKLERRFHAHCYWYLSKCLDTHHIGRGRGSIPQVLAKIDIPTTVIGIDSDMLIPPSEQRLLAQHIPQANYHEIHSDYGHDGFLLEKTQINPLIQAHLQKCQLKWSSSAK